MPLKSVLERTAPRSPEAESRLVVLRLQARDFAIASAAAVAGTGLAVSYEPGLAVPLAAATVTTVALGCRSLWRRRELVRALMRERDAYAIDAVCREGKRFATAPRRHRLGGWLRKLVRIADGEEPPPSLSLRVIDDRVRPRRERLLRLADALEDDRRQVHPASVALLHHLLTIPGLSPLYNPGLDADLVDLALHRIEAGIAQL
jgi:hypothetical protein